MGPGGSDAAGQLADAPQLLDRLASVMPDATLLAFDADLQVVAARGRMPEPASPGFVQHLVNDIIATGSWPRVRDHYEATLRGERRAFDYVLREDETVYRVHFTPLVGGEGIEGVLAIAHELAGSHAAIEELERVLHHQTALADIARRALATGDPAELLQFACERAAASAGHGVGMLEPDAEGRLALTASAGLPDALHRHLPLTPGQALDDLVDDRACVVLEVDATARPGALVVVCRDDRPPDGDEARFFAAVADILTAARDRQRLEGELRQAALHDELTGLPNRTALRDHLRLGLARNQRYDNQLAVFFLDLDGFKAVNDEHGHGVGDAVLREVAARLQRALRRADLVARFGGDEFVVLCETIAGPHEVDRVVVRIRESFAEPFASDGHRAQLGVSVGVAVVGREVTDPDAALDLADAEMYRAKRAAR